MIKWFQDKRNNAGRGREHLAPRPGRHLAASAGDFDLAPGRGLPTLRFAVVRRRTDDGAGGFFSISVGR
jgi:hypothetical protein